MFSRNKTALGVAVAFFATLPAMAQQEPDAGGKAAADEIRQINEQIAVLSAKLAKIEVEAKIAAKRSEVEKLASPSGHEEIPVVRGIEGVDGKLRAQLAFRGGLLQTVGKGEKFGEWTVKEISVSAVAISRAGQTVRLSFGAEPPAAVPSSLQPGINNGSPFVR